MDGPEKPVGWPQLEDKATIKGDPMKNALLNRRRISVAVASAIAAATLPSVASAQSDSATVEEVIVTGTRLRNSNVTSATPLVQIGAQEIDDRGVARVEDVVNILPNVFVSQTSEVANGASGTSTLNLRGLGSTRTLVLIDGKRLPFGSPFFSITQLMCFAIKRGGQEEGVGPQGVFFA